MSELAERQAPLPSRAELRAEIARLEAAMKEHPAAVEGYGALDLMHHFTDGIYMRTVRMNCGDLIVGRIHKKEHLVVVSAGRARVVSEEWGAKEIVAPMIFKSPPGAKRVLLILEDMVWTTVHSNPTNTEDLAALEAEFIAADYSEVVS
jgi:hypothetical protein